MLSLIHWIRAVVRLEARSIVANPWRTLLVVALIGLPVAAIIGGNNLLFVTRATSVEKSTAAMGVADARIETSMIPADLRARLPEGTLLEPISMSREQLVLNGLRLSIVTCSMELDGLASGIRKIVKGRAPVADSEVAVTASLLEVGDIQIGDVLLCSRGEAIVVGVVEDSEQLGQLGILFPIIDGQCHDQTAVLVSLPKVSDVDSIVNRLPDEQVLVRRTAGDTLPPDAALVFTAGGFALAEAAMIVAAAFIVGIRRRQRELGLLASAGATRFQVMSSVLVSATITSLIAAIGGLIVALVVAWVIHPFLDQWNGRRNGPLEVCWGPHLLAMLMGVFTAVASAFIPAFQVAKMPLKLALSSRRPAPGNSRRWVVGGALLILIAIVLVVGGPGIAALQLTGDVPSATLVMLGSILGVIGLGVCSPWILSCAACLASWLPLSWRLAIRETGRFRTRNGPIVTSIIAGMALSVMFATVFESVRKMDQVQKQFMPENHVLVTGSAAEQVSGEIVEQFDSVASAELFRATTRGRPLAVQEDESMRSSQIAVDGGDLLEVLGVEDPGGLLRKALESGTVLSLGVEIDSEVKIGPAGSDRILSTLPSMRVDAQPIGQIGFVISESTMNEQSWQRRRGIMARELDSWLVRMKTPVDKRQLDQLAAVASKFPQTSVTGQPNFTTDRSQLWSFFFVSLLSGLLVIAIATALATAESKSDRRILETVGASPSVARHQSAARSAFLALLGCLLAIPAGILPAYGVIAAVSQLQFSIPWFEIAVVSLGLPAAAYMLTLVFSSFNTFAFSRLSN